MIFDTLEHSMTYYGCHKNFEKAFDFIQKALREHLPVGKYEIDGTDVYASIQEYNTHNYSECRFEGHRKYIDIQYIVSGVEVIEMTVSENVTTTEVYSETSDVEFFSNTNQSDKVVVPEGKYGIFFPYDLHKPGIALENPAPVKKIVVKIKA